MVRELEQNLLAIIQDAFPLEERPYQVLADKFSTEDGPVTEQQVFEAVENLRKSGVIRRIGGVYDSKALGFISRLCAGKVTDIDKFTAAINEISAITHNYVRSHEYNVWFTVIAQSEGEIRKIVDGLCASTDLHDVHILSATKKFKINTVMRGAGAPVDSGAILSDVCNPDLSLRAECNEAKQSRARELSTDDRARISIACDDIPHTLTPFKDWSVSIEELRDDLAKKRMRRFGAILRHQEAGFAYNAMVCFGLDERRETKDERGNALAQKSFVSHCYERPVFEGFPYNLYAMIHAQSSEELAAFVEECVRELGNPDYVVLHSVKELKKTSFRYFA
ncbi:Lrp/AsnC family transcriptional regulator [uncultured Fibrobacter sp.]|uniref:Lrp/AsnC family transcriptional regulator n=1 Tax=uncultured Fibrobacter sp. TaxID=261512 RepID=UPI0025CF3FEF|nr:Lrp/AsnC family transcriptional regulator [uncultured Fibrobacter sp.]